MRNIGREPADARFRQLRKPQQQMTLAPWIVGPPSGTAWLTPGAGIEHVTGGEVAIGPLHRWELRRVALLAAQTIETIEAASPELGVAVPTRRNEDRQEQESREVWSISQGRNHSACGDNNIRMIHAHRNLSPLPVRLAAASQR